MALWRAAAGLLPRAQQASRLAPALSEACRGFASSVNGVSVEVSSLSDPSMHA